MEMNDIGCQHFRKESGYLLVPVKGFDIPFRAFCQTVHVDTIDAFVRGEAVMVFNDEGYTMTILQQLATYLAKVFFNPAYMWIIESCYENYLHFLKAAIMMSDSPQIGVKMWSSKNDTTS
ncbi:hypothetical protein GMSM_35680 [Geomonas sp. Red276]